MFALKGLFANNGILYTYLLYRVNLKHRVGREKMRLKGVHVNTNGGYIITRIELDAHRCQKNLRKSCLLVKCKTGSIL